MNGKIGSRQEEGDAQRMRSGQSSMLLIIIVLAMFIVIALFLLQAANKVSSQGFTQEYADGLLQSIMRTDTGYTNEKCRTVADLVACACFSSDFPCGSVACGTLANQTLTKYMAIFWNQSKDKRYLFASTSDVNCIDQDGNSKALEIGDPALKSRKEKVRVYSQPLVITKSYAGGDSFYMKVQLIVAPSNSN
jgi:hypothetical protein